MRAFEALLSERERQLLEALRPNITAWRELALTADQHLDTERGQRARAQLFREAAGLGLQRARASERVDGLGLDARERVVLLEALAEADAGLAVSLAASWSVSRVLEALAPPSVFARCVAPVLTDETGAHSLAAAATEPDHGSEVHSLTFEASLDTRLTQTDAGLRLSGTKWMMTNGGHASAYLVLAQRDDAHGRRRVSVVVQATQPGVSTTPILKRGLRTTPHATLVLDQVPVTPDDVLELPDVPRAVRLAGTQRAVAQEALSMAAIALGLGVCALETARAWADQRRQAGKLLRDEPLISLRLLESAGRLDVLRGAVWHAAALEQADALELSLGTAVRAEALECARLACVTATATVGSAAIEASHLLSKLSRDVEVLAVALGSSDFWRHQLSSSPG